MRIIGGGVIDHTIRFVALLGSYIYRLEGEIKNGSPASGLPAFRWSTTANKGALCCKTCETEPFGMILTNDCETAVVDDSVCLPAQQGNQGLNHARLCPSVTGPAKLVHLAEMPPHSLPAPLFARDSDTIKLLQVA